MADGDLVLNLGAGGETLDVEDVTFPSAPLTRVRERVQIAGALATEIARVRGDAPASTDMGAVVRAVGLPNEAGTWGYRAGASGTIVIGAGARVLSIAAHAAVAGTMTVNGGDSIPIPALSQGTPPASRPTVSS